jgi:hypothetical protein
VGTTPKTASKAAVFCRLPTDRQLLLARAIVEFIMAVNSMENMSGLEGVSVQSNHWIWALPWLRRKKRRWCDKKNASDSQKQRPKEHNEEGRSDSEEIKWTLSHSYFANMGGFRRFVKWDEFDQEGKNRIKTDFLPEKSKDENIVELCPLTAAQFASVWGYIKQFRLSEEEIKDKSKADFFTKTIALVQISSLFFSVITREIQDLAFSQLELVTLAFAVCAVLTYLFRWYKPQGIGNSHKSLALQLPRALQPSL